MAETYDRVAVPWFRPMASDLVSAVHIPSGARVLDIGTGTGLTAELATRALASAGVVVGVDPSIGMLSLARRLRRVALGVAAGAPGLPLPDGTFDTVLANLVISHFPDLERGLKDMVRVLRPGGCLGVTAWGPDPADPADQGSAADAIISSERDAFGFPSEAPVKSAPWEEHLRNRSQLCSALIGAGIQQVDATLHSYSRRFTVEEYLSGWGGLYRYLRSEAGEERWREFSDSANRKIRERIGDSVTSVKRVWIATGRATSSPR